MQVIERLDDDDRLHARLLAKASMNQINDDMRYWTLLRGSPGAEMIVNKQLEPDTLRLIDLGTIEWHEKGRRLQAHPEAGRE
jgi:hypothetical protein